ncbi:formate dehydrogenase/NADH-quinone oxidoreductase subunit F [Nonomuraea maritima]|uniref:Formate dehydrogenase/NADH-quinone oxidoreductase subunit F n=1 Tax=Nonomuraea maritima TaxID=683260 RepID=A0A1G9RRL7_9ACTN|nr:NAD(P)H-dependent oxidoreductase subunit E [Nonomuraea maritima]SDM25959.1 formate dehydrogenase/NADH-quinone oxidoreductase subunit F [Nonomuraea maritima]
MTLSFELGRPRVPGVEARAGKFPGPSLIPDLNAIQARLGWLPREELEELSRTKRRPLYEIEGLISFYPHFRTTPPAKVAVNVCHDLSCWLRQADDRIAEVRERYGDDAEIELVEVSCLGRCDSAPALAVNEVPAPVADVDTLVTAARQDELDEVTVTGRAEPWPNDPYPAGSDVSTRYASLRALLAGELSAESVVATLEASGLRGMGGAGFPTGRKWGLVAAAEPGSVKYAICNADESEPGTFKDRQILTDQPHLVIEGLLLGMAVVGAEQGWIFIRHEYGPEERVLHAEIEALRAAGVIGENACGSGRRLDLDIFVSPGGYILGEETALLECMEGHRGEPRNKPPFPGNYGLHGRPTLINSVETFADVPVILQRGADWWAEQGAGDSVGWKFFAVSGHVENPGVYCVPMGTTVRRLIDEAGGVLGGAEVGAVQPGGASSNFIGPDKLDLALDFGTLAEAGTMLGSGAMVVLAEGTDLLAASTNVLRFFRNESCGKCVPCRVGSTKAHDLLRGALDSGSSTLDDAQRGRILQLEETMRKTSICGLGQVALGPVVSVLGLDKGAAAARPQPRPEGSDEQPDR